MYGSLVFVILGHPLLLLNYCKALHERYHYENDLSFNRIIIEGVGLDLGHLMMVEQIGT
jgi:hypothetical protein